MPRKTLGTPEKHRVSSESPRSPSFVRSLRNAGSPSTSPSRSATRSPRPGSLAQAIAPPARAALSPCPSPDALGSSTSTPRGTRFMVTEGGTTTNTNTTTATTDPSSSSSSMRTSPSPIPALRSTTPTPTTTEDLLKQKDDRIAHLELSYQRTLDALTNASSSLSSFSSLTSTTAHELRLLRLEADALRTERDELRSDWNAAQQSLREREDEIRDLRRQMRGLKEWVSNSTRAEATGAAQQVSDEVLGAAMAKLGNELQNWVLVNFRRAKVKTEGLEGVRMEELEKVVPMFEEILGMGGKIHLIQSVVSRLLVEMVFRAYFVGLTGKQERVVRETEEMLGAIVSTPESINQWRALTLSILKREADQKLQAETAAIIDAFVNKTNNLLGDITEVDTKAIEARNQGLRHLVNGAIDMSRLLVVQKAIFKVNMPEILPHQRVLFDAATMEDIGGEDEENLSDREICCVTFPGIIKQGDESGGQLQWTNVITKARVLCSPEV
ncbi:hypothetical protein GE21DRAFT_3493 [Neurospora crassa]|uniref:Uncharacterized protein n=2 Tax=Neurospora crassa TaxID=5141 RepID=Q1K4Q5_NEUCR|nr:hypothetical protein NCU01491 [Neurospora crassa OR74A]EAA26688.1 hypothetical protein NCU01491 [Neurospora crassa OR74A]KHE80491.1 hypothetical protein GE21DRAFT_3493 [Neurospora crassa]CAB99233.1 hypothetical protein [Neurospora crassa]|eukprot:XP_955924.1 hypothetical protein NCU01491 [Neurospora crassa OR74A]